MGKDDEPDQTQMKLRMDSEIVAWCHAEAAKQQRTVGFFVENALKRYRDQIEYQRGRRRLKRKK